MTSLLLLPLSLFSFNFFSISLCSCRSYITLPIWFIVAIESYCHIFATASFFLSPFTTLYVWCYNDLLRKSSMPIFHTYISFSVYIFSKSLGRLWIRNGLHWIGRNFSPSASSQRIIAHHSIAYYMNVPLSTVIHSITVFRLMMRIAFHWHYDERAYWMGNHTIRSFSLSLSYETTKNHNNNNKSSSTHKKPSSFSILLESIRNACKRYVRFDDDLKFGVAWVFLLIML